MGNRQAFGSGGKPVAMGKRESTRAQKAIVAHQGSTALVGGHSYLLRLVEKVQERLQMPLFFPLPNIFFKKYGGVALKALTFIKA